MVQLQGVGRTSQIKITGFYRDGFSLFAFQGMGPKGFLPTAVRMYDLDASTALEMLLAWHGV